MGKQRMLISLTKFEDNGRRWAANVNLANFDFGRYVGVLFGIHCFFPSCRPDAAVISAVNAGAIALVTFLISTRVHTNS